MRSVQSAPIITKTCSWDFVKLGDEVVKGERISLIQFGSRANIYLPLNATVKVKVGDRAVGGETVLATYE